MNETYSVRLDVELAMAESLRKQGLLSDEEHMLLVKMIVTRISPHLSDFLLDKS